MSIAFTKDIGSHCKLCNTLDYLPWRCDRCATVCCHDCRDEHPCTETPMKRAVQCATCRAVYNPASAEPHACAATVVTTKPKLCRIPGCKARGPIAELAATKCKLCSEPLCIDHRFACPCKRKTAHAAPTKRELLLDAALKRAQQAQPIETR